MQQKQEEKKDFDLFKVVETDLFEMLIFEQSLEGDDVWGKVVAAEGSLVQMPQDCSLLGVFKETIVAGAE